MRDDKKSIFCKYYYIYIAIIVEVMPKSSGV